MSNNRNNNIRKEKMIMIASSALVMVALTAAGVFMRNQSGLQENDGYSIDFHDLENGADGDVTDQLGGLEENAVPGPSGQWGNTDGLGNDVAMNPLGEDALGNDSMQAADSNRIELPGLTGEGSLGGEGLLEGGKTISSGENNQGTGEKGQKENSASDQSGDTSKKKGSAADSSGEKGQDSASQTLGNGVAGQTGDGLLEGEAGQLADAGGLPGDVTGQSEEGLLEGETLQVADAGDGVSGDAAGQYGEGLLEGEAGQITDVAEGLSGASDGRQLAYSADQGLVRPTSGEVLMHYSMTGSIYFATLDQYKYNPAVMLKASEGDSVMACAEGQVLSVFEDEEIGQALVLDLGNGYQATYGQLQNLTVSPGSHIYGGDILGYVAAPTKYYSVEGTNVYFCLTKDGIPVNPEDLFH